MMQKKICLLGAFAVGKTSLVARFVQSLFSEKYHTTVGVKIDKKVLTARGQEMTLMIWDIAGEDEFHAVEASYLRGASGYLLVADGTRRRTLDQALALQRRMQAALGALPFVVLLNKADLVGQWEVSEDDLEPITSQGWPCLKTSARTGEGVEAAFLALAEKLLPD